MKVKRVFTGSRETEDQLYIFCEYAYVDGLDTGVPTDVFEPYWLKVMVQGRNGPGDRYPGSEAFDDTGGFFRVENGQVFLTDKAKGCITL